MSFADKRCRAGSQDSSTESERCRRVVSWLTFWRGVSAILLVAMGELQFYLVSVWVSTPAGVLFAVNSVGGVLLAVPMVLARRWLLPLACGMGLLFITSASLELATALSVDLYGICEQLAGRSVVPVVVTDSVATVVLAVTTALVLRVWLPHENDLRFL
jgi:hypothetical protein